MKKTLFLTIFAGCLSIIAILAFTTGCDSQADAKTMQQNTETSTTVAETTSQKADNTVATKPSEPTKATTAATEAQTQDLKEDPTQEQVNEDWVNEDIYNNDSGDQLLPENEDAEPDNDDAFVEEAYNDEEAFAEIIMGDDPVTTDDHPYEDIITTPDKDHVSYQPPWPDYDPMLFNDKERPRYESCDHEWVEADWGTDPDGSSHIVIECSICHVTLNQWLYNGYSE